MRQVVRQVWNYLSEVRLELSKVTWPKKDAIIRLTLTVLIISTAVGLYVGGIDYLFTKLLEIWIVR